MIQLSVCSLTTVAYVLLLCGSAFSRLQGPHGITNAQVPVETRTLDELHQAALKETGVLRVSFGGDAPSYGTNLKSLFEKRFPGITLNISVDVSKYLDGNADRFYESTKGEDNGVDCILLQTLNNFPRWKAQRRLLPYKVAEWDDIYPEFKEEDGSFTSVFIYSFGTIYYRPDKLAESEVPSTYDEFAKPFWQNKLVMPYPNDDDAVLYLFSLITSRYGWEYIDALVSRNITWARGTATQGLLLAQSPPQSPLAASFSTYTVGASALVVTTKTPNDTYMTWPQTAAIFATTKMPETAKLFLNYLASDEYQQLIAVRGYATRKKFDTAQVLKNPHADPLGFGKFLEDQANVNRWRLQFENIIGLPQGPDPITYGI